MRVPYPVLLVIGGGALGFVPGVPEVRLEPDLVLLIALPPLLYAAAFFSSLRDLRANLRPITTLSLGLVLATMVGVAAVAHYAIGLDWPVAFVLGAIVSPTDPVAATAIAGRLGVSRRIVTIVEGESLVNDATALVAYRFAVAAVVTGSFSLWEAGGRFVLNAAVGIAIGLAVGWVVAEVRRRIEDPPTEIALSLFTAYFAYLPAEAAGVSGVLAAVTVGIYLGWLTPQLISPATRIQAFAVWEVLVFVLNALLFVLIGLQLPAVLDALGDRPPGELLGYAALVSGAVVAIRFAWVYSLSVIVRRLDPRVRERAPTPNWHATFLVAYTGMRGAVSLAAALALPLETDAGGAFPERDLVVFLAFSVIVVTLVGQGLTLPWVIDRLDVEDDGAGEREENEARALAARAALQRLEELEGEDWVRPDTAERVRGLYQYRDRRFTARHQGDGDHGLEERSRAYRRLVADLLDAQRAAVIDLRNRGGINDEVMHRIVRDLDLEQSRLG